MVDPNPKSLTLASKVSTATVSFWIVKVLTTGMGEAASDFLLHSKHRAAGESVVGAAFATALLVQILSRHYHALRYWTVVALVAIFGTMVADVIDFRFHLPLILATAVFGTLVGAVLLAWWLTERTLSIHSITTRRRESFYWATVFLTFVLGTAAGDLTADTLQLGFLGSGIVFAAMMLVPLIAHQRFGFNEVLCFWVAYIITRPLGASFADWMSAPHSHGGLGMGPGTVSVLWAAVIGALVLGMAIRSRHDAEPLNSAAQSN